jgi:hypothetical protein
VAIGRAVSAFRARPLAVFWSCTELIYFIVRSALGLSWPPTSIYALLRSLYALGSSSPSAVFLHLGSFGSTNFARYVSQF